MIPDFILFTKRLERTAIKLCAIVRYEDSRDAEMSYDILPEKLL